MKREHGRRPSIASALAGVDFGHCQTGPHKASSGRVNGRDRARGAFWARLALRGCFLGSDRAGRCALSSECRGTAQCSVSRDLLAYRVVGWEFPLA